MTDDPELQEIFTDPGHQEVVDLLQSGRPATPPLDPHFRSYLRAKLMTEARRTLPRQARRSWLGLGFKPRTLALSMAAVAAGFLVVLGVQIYLHGGSTEMGQPVAVDITKTINNKSDVSTAAEPIRIPFSGPVDKNAVAESVIIEPATSVTKQWIGSTLVITPNHALAPNTTYTVRLQASATPAASAPPSVKATPTAAPSPVVVHFSTVRPPIPPVTAPSFASSNVAWVSDSRLDKSGTILNAVWTGGGQLLATRPAGQPGSAASATPSATPSSSPASGSATDVWLLSQSGTPLLDLAPGASLPSAPSTPAVRMFAAWSVHAGQANLEVRDLQGNLIATVATIKGTPERAAIWLGSDRLAYVDGNGTLNVVDLHGNSIALPQQVKVTHGSVEASPSGGLIAVDGVEGPVVLDLAGAPAKPLPSGATGFDWSAKGDLAFLVQQPSGSDLYVAADGKQSTRVASSPAGQTWSDLNWAPDASSLLLATKPADSSSGAPSLLVVNRDGSHMVPFGAHTEYTAPEWSPDGNLVLFTRHDDATGGVTFQVATVSISGTNSAEQQAIAEVDRFMKARLAGDRSGALAELDSNGQAAFQSSGALLTSAAGSTFDRYYPVTVQLTRTTPSTFLIGVRTFIAKPGGAETSFFEEQLTVVQQDQRYLIHDVQASPSQPLSHGPTVVSVEVLQTPPGQQIRVRFDADLKAETVTNGTVQVKTQDGTLIQSQVTFDPETHLATLAVKLRPGTYQLVVTIGVSDINNVPLAQEYDAPLVISR